MIRSALLSSLVVLLLSPLSQTQSAFPSKAIANAGSTERVRFNRDIRPILSEHCFICHGEDRAARKSKLRLDTHPGVLAQNADGHAIVVPGDPASSLLIQRVTHSDPKERMPADAAALDPHQIDLLRRWIAEGASWEEHWSYQPFSRQTAAKAPESQIDRLLGERHMRHKIAVAPPANARTLIRRLYFDVCGLPPTPVQVAEFTNDPSEQNYRAILDRLLASPQHAERLTQYWLDLVRYGDSSGIHGDQEISMSPYRDWVIKAFLANMRFDQFTREQLAGDLLPNATLPQLVASGYNRLNIKTAEGGAQDAEYLAKYAADRVRTTSSVWLGTTLGCTECHDHKFDPFTTRDFYRFAAFFADLDHRGFYGGANSSGDWGPSVLVPTAEQTEKLTELEESLAKLELEYASSTPALRDAQASWEQDIHTVLRDHRPPTFGEWSSAGPFKSKSVRAAHKASFGPEQNIDHLAYGKVKWLARPTWKDAVVHKLTGANSATYLKRTISSSREQSIEVSLGSDDSIKLWLNGKKVLDHFVTRGVVRGQEKITINLQPGANTLLMKVCNGSGGYGFVFEHSRTGPPAEIAALLEIKARDRSEKQARAVTTYFHSITALLVDLREEVTRKRLSVKQMRGGFTKTLISRKRKTPRTTRVLPRGNWQDLSGEVVKPGVPEYLRASADQSGNATRLDLARWLTTSENPLVARTFVNRLWRMYFGRGLSATLDDMGSRGDWPRHLALLDWLAAEFSSDWDVRRITRIMLTSEAYRRSSTATPSQFEHDPQNLEFARQAQYRHDAEVVRDQALAVSGLLDLTLGGPSVKPYQPAGYWAQLNFPRRTWKHDKGPAQYRRGLYTHWQRTFLHPMMRAFDAPSREVCTAERARSNTPLQALALLNDPSFVEAARVLAANIIKDGGETFDSRLDWALARMFARRPRSDERETLKQLYSQQRKRYATDIEAARRLTSVGLAPSGTADQGTGDQGKGDQATHAAWTAVTRTLLNLHETITRN